MKKNRPESCGVGRLLFKAFVSVVLLLAASVSGAFAQSTIDVTGKVIDADGQPVVGASVVVAGTYTGTTTGADGGFALKAREGQELEVSFIGMSTQRVPVSAVPVTVTLESESTMIEQAVVIGYGTAKKRDLTGSIVNVDAATIANRPASNPLAAWPVCRSPIRVGPDRIPKSVSAVRTRSTASHRSMWWTECSPTTSTTSMRMISNRSRF